MDEQMHHHHSPPPIAPQTVQKNRPSGLQKNRIPQIYLDDVIKLDWGESAELHQENKSILPWHTFTLTVFRDHNESEADHKLSRPDAGKAKKLAKKGKLQRIQRWNFLTDNDEQTEFWMLYLHWMCEHLEPMTRYNVVFLSSVFFPCFFVSYPL